MYRAATDPLVGWELHNRWKQTTHAKEEVHRTGTAASEDIFGGIQTILMRADQLSFGADVLPLADPRIFGDELHVEASRHLSSVRAAPIPQFFYTKKYFHRSPTSVRSMNH